MIAGILTGMGADGASGLLQLKTAGAAQQVLGLEESAPKLQQLVIQGSQKSAASPQRPVCA